MLYICAGVVRGIGLQHMGAYVNAGAYYLVCIPVALLFGFLVHLKGVGLWSGLVAGATVQSISLFLLTASTNWEKKVLYLSIDMKLCESILCFDQCWSIKISSCIVMLCFLHFTQICSKKCGWTGFYRQLKYGRGSSRRNFKLEMMP